MGTIQIPIRDYAADMRELIEKMRQTTGYHADVLARSIHEYLLEHDRELLYGFLEVGATSTIRSAIVSIDATTRSNARKSSKRIAFQAAAISAEGGDNTALIKGFLQAVYVVDELNTRKELRTMRRDDVLYIAGGYEERGRRAIFEAVFFRTLAKKIGDDTVGDHFNNAQLAELRESLNK